MHVPCQSELANDSKVLRAGSHSAARGAAGCDFPGPGSHSHLPALEFTLSELFTVRRGLKRAGYSIGWLHVCCLYGRRLRSAARSLMGLAEVAVGSCCLRARARETLTHLHASNGPCIWGPLSVELSYVREGGTKGDVQPAFGGQNLQLFVIESSAFAAGQHFCVSVS